jgi:raffinose/stachyose/melibiose transport system permease protein
MTMVTGEVGELAAPAVRRRPAARRHGRWLVGVAFVLPAVLLNILIVSGPAAFTAVFSLTSWDGIHTPRFVGLDNYRSLLSDSHFRYALENNLRWLAVYCTVPLGLGLAASMALRGLVHGRTFFRTVFFLPYVLPTVVTAEIWSLIYSPFDGIDTVLREVGLPAPSWLGDPHYALWSVMVVDVWRYWAFVMVILLGALQQCDPALEEAARIDGAGAWRVFRHVIVPQLVPTIVLVEALSMLWSFTAFDYVFVMTQGGPGYTTEVMSTYMYKETFLFNVPGYASAMAVVMLAFGAVAMGLFVWFRRRGWEA